MDAINGDESVTPKSAPQVSLRPAQQDDESFLLELYSSTRKEELSSWGWDAAQQETFLNFQFTAQRRHFQFAYAEAEDRIILLEARPAGRFLVFRSAREIELLDIALLPEHQGRGIGAALISELIDEAAGEGMPVKLYVEKTNQAMRLYHRLGFRVVADTGVHYEMLRRPELTK